MYGDGEARTAAVGHGVFLRNLRPVQHFSKPTLIPMQTVLSGMLPTKPVRDFCDGRVAAIFLKFIFHIATV
jgi:hypothetical protein